MHGTEKKAPIERPVSLPAKVFQWVRRQPVVAALLLGTTATVVLVVALVWSLAPAGRSEPSINKQGKTTGKGRYVPGGPKRLPPGQAKKGNP
jgi:hypothetical protein